MLLVLENGVNFLKGVSLSLDPINDLWYNVISEKSRDGGARTYNQKDYDDIRRGGNHVIFQPILYIPVGITKTKRSLNMSIKTLTRGHMDLTQGCSGRIAKMQLRLLGWNSS